MPLLRRAEEALASAVRASSISDPDSTKPNAYDTAQIHRATACFPCRSAARGEALFTRNGYDWSDRYPWSISDALLLAGQRRIAPLGTLLPRRQKFSAS